MTQETITVENSFDEVFQITEDTIPVIGGMIIDIKHHDINWQIDYRRQNLKCKTVITSNINKIKIKTTVSHKKKNKTYERAVINKLHFSIKEKLIGTEENSVTFEDSDKQESLEKFNFRPWLLFFGVLLTLFVIGNILKNKNLKNEEEINTEYNYETVTYKEYEPVEIPDSVYKNLNTKSEKNNIEKDYKQKTNNFHEFNGKKVKFKSSFYDKEKNNIILNTNHEVTYHTIDFNKGIVTQKSKLDGKWIEFKYPINGFYKDGVTNVIIVNDMGVNEIWFSSATLSLGYDYMDGSRIACYGLSVVK